MMQLLHIVLKDISKFLYFLMSERANHHKARTKKEAINEAFPGTECSKLKMDRRPVNQW